ncbi:phosphopantetheine-binding protein [Bacillus cereus group sp. MYBK108-2]|uniref:phosphopantetheine-binding protein n=1 Tax=unclassified Bacillus cereus group TaxID=2750818 RepID=UPI00288D2EE2|nr:acyl carrier protein [Bacillus cereus]MDA2307636.1 acyl carrier protein [Bacillus cereus]HDX9634231.1 acyl carrier protein [Bacillus cereus]HEF1897118.1 acyl carrier protein [Bacillus cereus]
MNKWVNQIFTGLLSEENIRKINKDFDSYKSIPLSKLGLDSLATMKIVLNIETQFNKTINYEEFNIEDIETLEKVEAFLKS